MAEVLGVVSEIHVLGVVVAEVLEMGVAEILGMVVVNLAAWSSGTLHNTAMLVLS